MLFFIWPIFFSSLCFETSRSKVVQLNPCVRAIKIHYTFNYICFPYSIILEDNPQGLQNFGYFQKAFFLKLNKYYEEESF